MKKYINIILKVLFSVLLLMPIVGATGIFPAPTADMYNTTQAFTFIEALMTASYINIIMALVSLVAFVFIWTRRTAAAALLMIPITLNIVSFHAFLDDGIFTGGAVMGNIFFLINVYLLWENRKRYSVLIEKQA